MINFTTLRQTGPIPQQRTMSIFNKIQRTKKRRKRIILPTRVALCSKTLLDIYIEGGIK